MERDEREIEKKSKKKWEWRCSFWMREKESDKNYMQNKVWNGETNKMLEKKEMTNET